ncbi:hypothetical protein [Fodinibius salsisoli]|uniref:Uncharacterized protein n=1 Tax=Fodinibius salsisoli TaxID=2820877 RepID=A0ABT3PQF1_9BACT|nr:hypothetical protein [Fodinibius salsisoli]MCW9708092.1 hypothetical protein [Fodinibius salsisoli]
MSYKRRLDKIEENSCHGLSLDALTIADEPIIREDIATDKQKYIQVPTPFGMGLKPVDDSHPQGMTKQQHLENGNDIAYEVQ